MYKILNENEHLVCECKTIYEVANRLKELFSELGIFANGEEERACYYVQLSDDPDDLFAVENKVEIEELLDCYRARLED